MKAPITCILLILFGNLCKAQLAGYGIEQYGNTIEHPFHSAYDISQDSLGRIVINSSFYLDQKWVLQDGQFSKIPVPEKREIVYKEEGYEVLKTGTFEVSILSQHDTVHIDTRQHNLERQITKVTSHSTDSILRVHTFDGYVMLDKEDYSQIKTIHHDGKNIDVFHSAGDTLYYRGDRYFYIVGDDLSTITYYNIDKSINKLFTQLPDGTFTYDSRYINISDATLKYIKYSPYKHTMLSEDQSGNIWSYHPGDRRGLHIKRSLDSPWELVPLPINSSVFITAVYQDSFGDYWFGTAGQGVLHMYKKSVTVLDEKWGLSANNVLSISEDQENGIYINYNCQGVDIISSDNTNSNKIIQHVRDKECQSAPLHDKDGNVWIASKGVTKLDADYNLIKYFSKKEGLQSHTILVLFEDSSHRIWAGTRQCIHHMNAADGEIVKYCKPTLSVEDQFYNIVEVDKNHFLLANTNNKVYAFKDGQFSTTPSPDARLAHLHKDVDGTVWLATFDKGLYYYQHDKWIQVNVQNIPSTITFVQDGGQNLLFGLSQEQTIFYADRTRLKSNDTSYVAHRLSHTDGVPLINSNSQLQPSTQRVADGSVLFPNIHGAIWIDPKSLLREKGNFKTFISTNDTILTTQSIDLPYGSNDIQVDLHHSYLNPEATIQYSYKIDNSTYAECDNKLILNNLSPGWHTLYYKAKHLNQEWQSANKVNLYVPRLLHQTLWFWMLMAILLVLFIYGIVKWRLKNINYRNKELQLKVSEQTQIINKEKEQLQLSLKNEKRLSHELKLAQQSKNRMYAQISHEFKSPLQSISSYLSKNKVIYDDSAKKNIHKNIKNLLSISNEILELSKAESGNLKAKKNYYNINNIILEQIEVINPLAEMKDITLECDFDKKDFYLYLDLNLIQKTITNLLSNAIKFSHTGGTIKIKSITHGFEHTIAITDSGVGIPAEEIEHLTTAYFQASNNQASGTGIGLSLVKEILKLHDSELVIKSEEKVGSTFSFSLGLPDITQSQIIEKFKSNVSIPTQLDHVIDKSKPTLLAIDDNIDVLYFLTDVLRESYNVIQSTNAKDAITYLSQIDPELIISDINMPIMGGFEFIREIRNTPKYASTPFIFLTGSINEESELRGLKSGADVILRKPVQGEKIVTQVKSIMDRYKIVSHSAQASLTSSIIKDKVAVDDLELLQNLEQLILENIHNPKIKSQDLATALNIGEKTLRNKMKDLTGYTIKEYLRKVRMENAEQLINEGKLTKGQIADALGFSSLSYFSKAYKEYLSSK